MTSLSRSGASHPTSHTKLGGASADPTELATVIVRWGDQELVSKLAPGSLFEFNVDDKSHNITRANSPPTSTSEPAEPPATSQPPAKAPDRDRKTRPVAHDKGIRTGQRMMIYQFYLHQKAGQHVDWDKVAEAEKWLNQRRHQGNFYPRELDPRAIDVYPYNVWEQGGRSIDLTGATVTPSWDEANANAAIDYYRQVDTHKEHSPLYSYRVDWKAFTDDIKKTIGPALV